MATEKRKVNLVNLKTGFGLFLNKYYACQECHSIDKLPYGFKCEHKFCVDCNDGHLEFCKECKQEIENHTEDGLQNSLMPHFEDLKNIMNIDLKKVAAKKKLSDEQQKLQERDVNKEKNEENDQKEQNEPNEPNDQIERNEQNEQKEQSKSENKHTEPVKEDKQMPKPIVIIATSITEKEIKKLDKFAKKFNAKIVNEFSDEITHLVTLEAKPNLTTRTLKYLKSLLTHKWLLKFDWIQDSLNNNELVDEDEYELLGITKQADIDLGAPKRSREKQTMLFENKKFLIDGKFKSGLSKKDYEDLITIGGGEIVDLNNLKDDDFVVIEPGFKSVFKGRSNTFSTTDLLNYISNFEFDL